MLVKQRLVGSPVGAETATGKAKDLKFTCELNKAACYLKLQMFAEAKVACRVALDEQGRNVKAIFRRAQAGLYRNISKPPNGSKRLLPNKLLEEVAAFQAEMGLKNFTECISDCKRVLQLDAENRDAKVLLRQAVGEQKEADKKSKAVFASDLA